MNRDFGIGLKDYFDDLTPREVYLCGMHPFLIALFIFLHSLSSFASKDARVLIFGKSIRAVHADIIPIAGNALLQALTQTKKSADLVLDPVRLDQISIHNYDVIVLLDVSEKVLTEKAKKEIEIFVETGGGLVAIHASIGAARDWKWLQNLVGVQFVDHPPIQDGQISVRESSGPLESLKVRTWSQADEWYNFSSSVEPQSDVVMTVETKDKTVRPVAWTRVAGRGRFFYVAAGHSAAVYTELESAFMQTITSAINWAASSRFP